MSEFTEKLAESFKGRDINYLMTELGSASVVKSATSSTSRAGILARVEIELIRKEITSRVTPAPVEPEEPAKTFNGTTRDGAKVSIVLSGGTTASGGRVASSATVILIGKSHTRSNSAELSNLAQDSLDEIADHGKIILPFERYENIYQIGQPPIILFF